MEGREVESDSEEDNKETTNMPIVTLKTIVAGNTDEIQVWVSRGRTESPLPANSVGVWDQNSTPVSPRPDFSLDFSFCSCSISPSSASMVETSAMGRLDFPFFFS